MARAKKRKDGRTARTFTVEGKRRYIYGYSKQELDAKEQRKRKDIAAGISRRNNPTLNQYYETFTELRRNKVKENTLRIQRQYYNACAAVNIDGLKFGEMKIRDIRAKHCHIVQKALSERSRSRSTNDRMAHLKHVFNAAVKDETINRNPCDSIEPIRRTEPPARETIHRALTTDETEKFFVAAAESYYLNAFRLMLQTGLRFGELGALTNADIDDLGKCIHVTKTITRTELSGYRIGESPKTESSNRNIPMNETIRQIIRDQKEQNRAIFGNVLQMDGLLFRSFEGEILREYSVNREINRICKRCDIEKFTCHAFRATFATRFIEQRPQDYKVLSEILGHASTKITLDLYTHVMKETKQKAMDNIEIAM